MRLRKYMLVDLVILTVVGFLGELLGEYIINASVIAAYVTGSISLLVILVTTTRWKWKGLIVTPFLALAIVLSGHFFTRNPNYRINYDWKLFISIFVSFLAMSINLLWFKKISYKETFKKPLMIFVLCTIDYALVQLVLAIVYFILSQKFLFFAFIIWNLFSYAILLLGALVLMKQNVLVDIEASLREKQEEQQHESDFKFNLDEYEQTNDQEGVSNNGENS